MQIILARQLPRVWALLTFAVVASVVVTHAWSQDADLAEFSEINAQTDWPWWRGPWRNGVAADASLPTSLDEEKNLRWKTPVPGRGHSSPVVVGNRVFLTTADKQQETHYVLAFDRATGEPLWQTAVNRGAFPEHNHRKNTEATPTVACDGQRLFASFYHHDQVEVVALDREGKLLWKKFAGPFRPRKYEYGYAPSPLLYRNAVIVAAEYDGDSFLVALDRVDGRELWRTARPPQTSFSSPVVARLAGRDQLLLSGADQICSYDPLNGTQLWSTPGTTMATCGTIVWDGDIAFASGGFPKAETIAVRADGSGEVLWKNNQQCYEQSLLAWQGYVYALTDKGILYCWRANDGQQMWLKRLKGPISASPVIAGGHIYWANELGTLYVFRPNPKQFELVAENQIGTDSFASPAICGGQIFLRVGQGLGEDRQEFLYCFGPGK